MKVKFDQVSLFATYRTEMSGESTHLHQERQTETAYRSAVHDKRRLTIVDHIRSIKCPALERIQVNLYGENKISIGNARIGEASYHLVAFRILSAALCAKSKDKS